MKVFFPLLFIISLQAAIAQQVYDLFEEANQHYQKGEFESAVEKYELILSNGKESGELYYNLANAYYKLNRLGHARLNYERAVKWLDDDEAVIQNLELLKLRLIDQIEEPPRLFINVWWDTILNFFGLRTSGNILLVLTWFMLLSGAVYIYSRKRGRIRFKGLFVTLLVCWIFILLIWTTKIYLFETEKQGVILSTSVTVYAEPAANTTELFVIHEGTIVNILRSSGEWLEVRLIDGKTGWLSGNVLEVI
jgi:tetratricopeptide (TPR) repeat protein